MEDNKPLKELLSQLPERDKIIILGRLNGLTISELVHLNKTWVHIDDTGSNYMGFNYIKIPLEQPCNCDNCKLTAFYELKRKGEHKPKEWYKAARKQYWAIKGLGKLPKLRSKWVSVYPDVKIVKINNELKKLLKSYFKEHEELRLSRQSIWRISKLGGI